MSEQTTEPTTEVAGKPKMATWKKVVIGVAATVVAGTAGFFVYKKCRGKKAATK